MNSHARGSMQKVKVLVKVMGFVEQKKSNIFPCETGVTIPSYYIFTKNEVSTNVKIRHPLKTKCSTGCEVITFLPWTNKDSTKVNRKVIVFYSYLIITYIIMELKGLPITEHEIFSLI